MNPLLTLLLPTRGRNKYAKDVIDSYFDLSNNTDTLQIIVKTDHDDEFDFKYNHPNVIILKSDRLNGYPSLHTFANYMLKLATGTWISLGNDDALMRTKGWDKILGEQKVEPILLNTMSVYGETDIFPIIPTYICNKIGHFSLNAYTDRWLQNIFINKKTIPIFIDHINEQMNDRTKDDRRDAPCNSNNDWLNTENERKILIKKIIE